MKISKQVLSLLFLHLTHWPLPVSGEFVAMRQEVFSPKAVVEHLKLASRFWKPEPTENDGSSAPTSIHYKDSELTLS